MELPRIILLVSLLITTFVGSAMANSYNVGGQYGWSPRIRGWASGRSYQVGDLLIFIYDTNVDSVLQVTLEDYNLCFSLDPVATYKTGKDAITLNSPGDVYFISGNPQNCIAGEKLYVRVNDDAGRPFQPYSPYDPNGYPPRTSAASTSRLLHSTTSSSFKCFAITIFGMMLSYSLLYLP